MDRLRPVVVRLSRRRRRAGAKIGPGDEVPNPTKFRAERHASPECKGTGQSDGGRRSLSGEVRSVCTGPPCQDLDYGLGLLLTGSDAVVTGACAPGVVADGPAGPPGGTSTELGGSTGVMSAMFVSVPGGAFASTRRSRWTLTRWPGAEARDHETAWRPTRVSLRSARTNVILRRDVIADPEVAGDGAATVTDGDLVAREAAGAHCGRVGLLVDRHVAPWWTLTVGGSDRHVVKQVATTEKGRAIAVPVAGEEQQAIADRHCLQSAR